MCWFGDGLHPLVHFTLLQRLLKLFFSLSHLFSSSFIIPQHSLEHRLWKGQTSALVVWKPTYITFSFLEEVHAPDNDCRTQDGSPQSSLCYTRHNGDMHSSLVTKKAQECRDPNANTELDDGRWHQGCR